MAKRRRKLNKEMEQHIAQAKRKVELITAIINDIDEEDIQGEYRQAFEPAKSKYIFLSNLYDLEGFTEESQECLDTYNQLLNDFESEYEI